ncbi:MAG: putative FMN/FAD exporter YeeO [Phycisphaerae bacterium]|nr:putative FMN/FAD exporter YeeO [Phycisphaerae bacterium]
MRVNPPTPTLPNAAAAPHDADAAVVALADTMPVAGAAAIPDAPHLDTGPAGLPAGPISRQIRVLGLPILGEQVGAFLIGLTDVYLAGRVGQDATAAVGIAGYVGWFFTLTFSLVGVGATAIVSRAFGARRLGEADRALNQAFVTALVIGVILSGVAFVAAPFFARRLLQTPTAQAMCAGFLRIDSFGYALASLNLIGAAILRGAGDTRTPMRIMILVNVINAALSATLVFGWIGPAWGVNGIAIGTLTARCSGGVLMAAVMWRGTRGMRLRPALLAPDVSMQGRILRIGLPTAAESGVMWIAQVTFVWIVGHTAVGEAATTSLAAHMIAMRAEAVSYLPAFAWMTAAATLVGQYLGAGQPPHAARAAHTAAVQGAVMSAIVGVCFYTLAEQIYALMSDVPAVAATGAPAFRLLAFAQPFLAMGIIYAGSLRGAGDTRWPLAITALSSLCLRVPLAYLGGVVLKGGLIGAWCGMWADNFVRFALMLWRFSHGGWKHTRV